jgi:hypothetical protein
MLNVVYTEFHILNVMLIIFIVILVMLSVSVSMFSVVQCFRLRKEKGFKKHQCMLTLFH